MRSARGGDSAAGARVPEGYPHDVARPAGFVPRISLVNGADDGFLGKVELMSILISIQRLADHGNVTWEDGTEVYRESGMERDSTGDLRAFLGVEVRAGHEHGEPVDRDGRGNTYRQSIEEVRSPVNGFRPGVKGVASVVV